jgi:hypothetical protein
MESFERSGRREMEASDMDTIRVDMAFDADAVPIVYGTAKSMIA